MGVHQSLAEDFSDRFTFVEEPVFPLCPGVFLVEQDVSQQKQEKNLLIKAGWDDFSPDNFLHQQSLVVEGERSVTVFNSCCHGGGVAVAGGIAKKFPGKSITLLGGLHLMHLAEEVMEAEVTALGEELITLGITDLYPGHCTGDPAFQVLSRVLGNRLHTMPAGSVFTL